MGYNLYLACHTCGEYGFVSRGQEMVCIRRWGKRHPGSAHERDVAVDNGFAEKWFVDLDDAQTMYLPDDLWPELIEGPDARTRPSAAGSSPANLGAAYKQKAVEPCPVPRREVER